jgi:[acyl-carrier-protein] S-malonyltransferase
MAAATPGLGASLATDPAAGAVFAAFSTASGIDVARLVTSAASEELFSDRLWELAVVSTEIAACAAHRAAGGAIGGALGFSIGAYAALVAARAISVEQVVRMVDIVLAASQQLADPYAMIAVTGLPAARVVEACRAGEVELAATMTATQFLVAGRAAAVDALAKTLAPEALRVVRLAVRWPLHTSLMAPVANALARARLEIGSIETPAVPVYSAFHGRALASADEAWELLVGHLCHPQRLRTALAQALADGFSAVVELGPGDTLSRAARWLTGGAVERVEPAFANGATEARKHAC